MLRLAHTHATGDETKDRPKSYVPWGRDEFTSVVPGPQIRGRRQVSPALGPLVLLPLLHHPPPTFQKFKSAQNQENKITIAPSKLQSPSYPLITGYWKVSFTNGFL